MRYFHRCVIHYTVLSSKREFCLLENNKIVKIIRLNRFNLETTFCLLESLFFIENMFQKSLFWSIMPTSLIFRKHEKAFGNINNKLNNSRNKIE